LIFRDFFWFRGNPRNVCYYVTLKSVSDTLCFHFMFLMRCLYGARKKPAQNELISNIRAFLAVLCFFVLLIAILILANSDTILKIWDKFDFEVDWYIICWCMVNVDVCTAVWMWEKLPIFAVYPFISRLSSFQLNCKKKTKKNCAWLTTDDWSPWNFIKGN
jgi:hypothetical protein